MGRFKKGNPGRPKGCISKINRTVEATAERLGVDPFEILCLFARGDQTSLQLSEPVSGDQRLTAAKEAAKYLYSQKKAVEISNPDGTGFKITVEDYTAKK